MMFCPTEQNPVHVVLMHSFLKTTREHTHFNFKGQGMRSLQVYCTDSAGACECRKRWDCSRPAPVAGRVVRARVRVTAAR